MKKASFYIFYIFLLVIYLYSIVFDFFPLSTKIILEIVGLFSCAKYFANGNYRLKKEYRTIITLILFIVVWDIITSSLNGNSDFHLIKDIVPILGSIFGAQYLYSLSKPYFNSPNKFLIVVTVTIFGESVLALLMKASPALYELVDSFLVFDFGSDTIDDIFDLTRVFGIGNAHYFGVLATCILGTMTAAYLLTLSKGMVERVLLIVMWIVISFTSFLTARWAVFIIGLSGLLFVLSLRHNKLSTQIVTAFSFLFIGSIVLIFATQNVDTEVQQWAFGYFVDKDSSDHSADIVIGWWENTRFDIKTFIIGDAQYGDPRGGYYMNVDIGYFREIFYGGLIGLSIIIYSHVKILRYIYHYFRNRMFKLYLYFLMLGFLAAMAKGNLNMMTFFILILTYYSEGIFEKVKQPAYVG